eukprot:TRINITY_DN25186_c0_g1_i1.p1 TRINITY_DN25186_c0_g1~~TRINITY_DN25186_c0_g1_i1.p1  ORF type:complete len:214 (-),score=28.51 TRINITY_DN25186_c0_g1_i1:29-670(-)
MLSSGSTFSLANWGSSSHAARHYVKKQVASGSVSVKAQAAKNPSRGSSSIPLAAAAAVFSVFLAGPNRFLGRRGSKSGRISMRSSETEGAEESDATADSAHREPKEQSIERMRKFSNQYAKVSGTTYCTDKSVASVVIVGLAHHKETLGAPLCPCRHYEDKQAEAKNGYWNCPCVPMRERKECHCMLFLTDNNPFASDCNTIDLEEILKHKNY